LAGFNFWFNKGAGYVATGFWFTKWAGYVATGFWFTKWLDMVRLVSGFSM
jgi:hypothetical protein